MLEQKKYHQRKLAIIEMIEECEKCISNARYTLKNIGYTNLAMNNAKDNINRYCKLKVYLTERYNRN